MIQVQIASQLTSTGVDGVRWVLVEGASAVDTAAPAPAALLVASQGVAPRSGAARRTPPALSLALVKLLVVGLGVGLAIWVAQATLGPARLPWWTPAGAATTPRDHLPTHTTPRAAPVSPPASAASPLVTAVLS